MGLRNWLIGKLQHKESAVSRILISGSRQEQFSQKDYDKMAAETYVVNSICYRCIVEVGRSVASVPWGLYKLLADGEKDEITSHPIINLLKRPNPDESFPYLISCLMGYWLIGGNAYLERVTPMSGPNVEIPRELYVHSPSRITIMVSPDTGRKTGYKYTAKDSGNSHIFPVNPVTGHSNILHFKDFHPLDYWYGLAPTDPASREIDTNNASMLWNRNVLMNSGRPGYIMTVEDSLSDPQFDRYKKQLQQEYSGPENAGKALILEGTNVKIQPYGWSPQEMDFIKSNRELVRRIAYAYGVPPVLIGLPGDSTYNNQKEARLAFWEGTVIHYLSTIRGELNNWLFTGARQSDTLMLDYDLNNVPALAIKREALWKRAQEADFLTLNEKREIVGMDKVDGGDVLLVPANVIPLETAVNSTDEEEEVEDVNDQEEMEEEEERSISELQTLGYSREEAEEMIGIVPVEE